MPRKPREWIEGAAYHVFAARKQSSQAVFLTTRATTSSSTCCSTRRSRVTSSRPSAGRSCRITGICSSRCPEHGLSTFVKELNHRYALRFDRRWGRVAHVFQNRFGAVLQTTEEQFLWTLRYVIRNPVEAGLCALRSIARGRASRPPSGSSSLLQMHLRVDAILEHFGDDVRRFGASAVRRVRPRRNQEHGSPVTRRPSELGHGRRLTTLWKSWYRIGTNRP